jgi:hypothetical protein
MRPFCVASSVPVTASRYQWIPLAALATALGLYALPQTAVALVPDDLCTGNPCVISANVTIDSSVVLDFGNTTALEFAPDVSVLLQNGPTVHFQAGSITVDSGVHFRSDAPGASLYLVAETGDLAIAPADSVVSFILHDSVELGLYSDGNMQVRAAIDVRGYVGEAGAVSIQSLGDLTFTGRIRGDGSTSGFNASVISLEADGPLSFDGSIKALGQGGDSGQVSFSGATATLHGRINVNALVGVGGNVSVAASAGDVVLNSGISANGREALGDTGNFCDGG